MELGRNKTRLFYALGISLLGHTLFCQPASSAPGDNSQIKLKPEIPISNKTSPKEELDIPVDKEEAEQLKTFDKLEAKETILVNPEKLIVKPPVLKALIKLEQPVSPLHIEADSSRDVSLGDVLRTAMRNNLDIKISQSKEGAAQWRYYERLSNFLPDIVSSFSFQAIQGKVASPAGAILRIKSPYLTNASGFNWMLFKGGERIYRAKLSKHFLKSKQSQLKGTINDVLMQATKLYYDLVYADALLQIRVKAVEESKAILQLNEDLFSEGVATKLDVLQARTQLSRDRQALISQQIKRREAAVNLSTALYLNPEVDLNIRTRTIRKIRLIASQTRINQLISTALDKRPELPQKEEARLAALQLSKVRRSKLIPSLSFNGAVAGTGADIAGESGLQQIPLSSVTSTGSTLTPAVSGGATTPLANGGPGRRTFNMRALFILGMDVQWKLGGLGVTEAAGIKTAQYRARQAQLEYNKQLAKVYQEVRNSYNHSIDTEALVKETTSEVNSAEESLRIAVLRLKEGLGVQTDVIVAQRDYTQALLNKAKALCDYNVSQAQILHSTGAISFNTLTRGFRAPKTN